MKSKKIFIIAGEVSGDILGADLMKSIISKDKSVKFYGVGGEEMQKINGFKSLFNIKDIAVMGIFEVLKHLCIIKKRIKETINQITKIKPDLIITIDSPGFNMRIVKQIKKKTDKYKLGLLITDKYNINIVDFIFKTNLPICYLKPDFLAIKKTMLTKKYYKQFRDHYRIFIWTIKSENEILKYKRTYLDKISYICNIEK